MEVSPITFIFYSIVPCKKTPPHEIEAVVDAQDGGLTVDYLIQQGPARGSFDPEKR